MDDALRCAAHQLRLGRLERFKCCGFVSRRERLLRFPRDAADAALACMIDGHAFGILANALLGGVDIGHKVHFLWKAGFLATALTMVNGWSFQPFLNAGLRFSAKAAMPSFWSSVANMA